MNVLLKIIRWVLFLPAAFITGQIAAVIFFALALMLFGWSTPLTGLAVLITGALQPIVGAAVGRRIAPASSPWCQKFLMVIYGLIWASTLVLIVSLLCGQVPVSKLSLATPVLSAWWCMLLHSIGMLYGSGLVIQLDCERESKVRSTTQPDSYHSSTDPRPHLINPTASPFRWETIN